MADAKQIRDEIVESVKDALDRIGDDAGELAGRARKAAGEFSHRAADFADDFSHEATKRGRRAARYVVREVNDHPLATAAIVAVTTAAILGLIMASRRR